MNRSDFVGVLGRSNSNLKSFCLDTSGRMKIFPLKLLMAIYSWHVSAHGSRVLMGPV